jgi:uncharacterized protein YciI
MYAIAIVRYRKTLEEVTKLLPDHRAYLGGLKEKGLLVASGPLEPWNGGALLLRVPDGDVDAALSAIRDGDPYVKAGLAQYELLPWKPVLGMEGLDKL